MLFFALSVVPGYTAWQLLRWILKGQSASIGYVLLFGGAIYFAVVHLSILVFGILGLLHASILLLGHFVLAMLASFLPRGKISLPRLPEIGFPILLFPVAFWIVFGVFAIGWYLPAHHPDSLVYHLTFPVLWLKARELVMTFTTFGAIEPPYSPLNGQFWTLWWMMPFQSDHLAKMSQFPFYLLAALALFRLARQNGATRRSAFFPPLLFLTTSSVFQQAASAYVDVTFAAWIFVYLSAILDLNDALCRKESTLPSLILAGISFGEVLGTKYSALLFAPILVLPLVLISFQPLDTDSKKRLIFKWMSGFRLRNRRVLLFCGVIFLISLIVGGFTYFRNFVLTGNIIYPAHFELFGHRIMQGVYGRAEMTAYQYHLDRPAYIVYLLAAVFGERRVLLIGLLPLAFWISLVHCQPVRWQRFYFFFLFPLLYLIVHFYASPFNSQHRFLYPIVGLSYVALTPLFDLKRVGHLFECLITALVLWETFWPMSEIQVAIFRFSAMALTQNPVWCALSCGLLYGASISRFLAREKRYIWNGIWILTLMITASGILVGTFQEEIYPATVRYPAFSSQGYWPGWLWVNTHLKHAQIAYAGHNYTYPLFGSNFTNDVRYVQINARRDWIFHDFDLYFRNDPSYKGAHNVIPVIYRHEADFDAWVENLEFFRIQYLVTYPLDPVDQDSIRDESGFPIEDIWARNHPDRFEPVFAKGDVRIYKFDQDSQD